MFLSMNSHGQNGRNIHGRMFESSSNITINGLLKMDHVPEGYSNDGSILKITEKDITEANRLSHSCPICASAVEKSSTDTALAPVICSQCHTLYHKNCWEQNEGKCATLGCEHTACHPYGTELGPRLKIKYSDIPKHAPKPLYQNGREKRLKALQRQHQGEEDKSDFLRQLFSRILRAFGWR